jgi:two-component sensor histidine kinase/ActR/RegA family two-component response regulator
MDIVPNRTPKILYIDDDLGICRLVQKDLERLGYHITCVRTGAEGLAILKSEAIDIVCLDHFLEGETGLDVIGQILAMPNRPAIIYVTGSDDINVAVSALKAGAVDYVVKDVRGAFLTLLRRSTGAAIDQLRLRRAKDLADQEIIAANERLRRLTEKQAILLHEMNHRIGNSLQLIISMIRLQASAIPDENAKAVLRQAAERVIAVAQVHHRLYTSDDVQSVPMRPYLNKLMEDHQILASDRKSRLTVEIADIKLPTDQAISTGIVVSELVTNSVKYAYPDGGGPIHVELSAVDSGLVRLAVIDEGVGFAPGHQSRGTGVGSKIVEAMARSLGARLEVKSGPTGTQAIATFPISHPTAGDSANA